MMQGSTYHEYLVRQDKLIPEDQNTLLAKTNWNIQQTKDSYKIIMSIY